MRRISKIYVNIHPSMYNEMEKLRKFYEKKNGIRLSQVQTSNLLAQRIRPVNINKIDLIGGILNVKKKG